MQLLASYPYLTLYLHTGTTRAIEAQWRGSISSNDFCQGLILGVKLARQHRASGFITDERQLGDINAADLLWVVQHALPILADVGVTRFARVQTSEVCLLLAQMPQQELPALPFPIRLFPDEVHARTWARAQSTA